MSKRAVLGHLERAHQLHHQHQIFALIFFTFIPAEKDIVKGSSTVSAERSKGTSASGQLNG